MRHSLFGFNERNRDVVTYKSCYLSGCNSHTNKTQIIQMKEILSKAIVSELTHRQRDCVVMYYYENMKMIDIARALNLSKSTVSRHIKAAEAKLKNVAKYYS